jgi:polar amino acid transport system substrate-binding protein
MRTTLLTALCVTMSLTGLPCAEEAVILMTASYEPFVIDDTDSVRGAGIDIVRAAFQESGVDVEFRCVPWRRGQNAARNGTAFAAFPYVLTDERTAIFDFSSPVIGFSTKFFFMKENFPDGFDWEVLADLKPYRVGGIRGYWYESAFKAAGLNVYYVSSESQAIHLLRKGRIHLAALDEMNGLALIDDLFPELRSAFGVARKPQSTTPLRLMISRKYPRAAELTTKFNDGLKAIVEKRTYHEILRNYGIPMEYAVSE